MYRRLSFHSTHTPKNPLPEKLYLKLNRSLLKIDNKPPDKPLDSLATHKISLCPHKEWII
jgi:hypothetical protein